MESMNKNKLQLPKHEPRSTVWDTIAGKLSNAELKGKLKSFEPSSSVWNSIERQLTESNLKSKLSSFEPQDTVWRNIEKNLKEKGTLSIIRSYSIRIAVTVLIALSISVVLSIYTKEQKVSYTEVWIEPINLKDWEVEEDQEIVSLLAAKEEERPQLLKSKDYLFLKSELEGLIESKKLILTETSSFNDDVELELLLTKIELEKNELVRNLISYETT